MTAAHCTAGIPASKMKVYVYRHAYNGTEAVEHTCAQTIEISQKFEHSNYSNCPFPQNDISLLHLSQVHPPPHPGEYTPSLL